MLLRLAYLALTSVFALVRLLPMSDADRNIEILTLRPQLAILQRQIDKPRLTRPTGRRRATPRTPTTLRPPTIQGSLTQTGKRSWSTHQLATHTD